MVLTSLIGRTATIASALAILSAIPAEAETLHGALTSAYVNNPTLEAERARLRSVDEQVPQALSGWRPTVIANADYGHTRVSTRPASGRDRRDPGGFSVSLNQPVFTGLKTVNRTRQAKANVLAGRASLANVQQSVLLDAVTAYMDVLRDQAIVRLRRKNISFLSEQLRAADARFRVGEVTRTDVAQARARRSGAISSLALARSTLAASRARYTQIIGHPPANLRYPPSIAKLLPKSLNAAIDVARRQNPALLGAVFNEEASRHAVEVARGDLLPELSLEAQYNRRWEPSRLLNRQESASVIGRLTVPFYQGGLVYSQVRQAKEVNSQRRIQISEAAREVVAQVVTAWELWRATREQIRSDRVLVQANTLALSGVRQEALVGSRTTLDVLDAEQELLDAQVQSVGTRRDEVVASYQVLAAIGRLTAFDLQLKTDLYDPTRHYELVDDQVFGTSVSESD